MDINLPIYIDDLSNQEVTDYIFNSGKFSAQEMRIVYRVATRIYQRTLLSEAQNHKCCFCGTLTYIRENRIVHAKHPTVEHVIPKSKGGRDVWENFAMSCFSCNNRRGDKDIEEFWNENANPS